MKNQSSARFLKLTTYATIAAFAAATIGCQTTYDANGNPRETVDPAAVAVGAVAAGVVGYAIGNNHSKNKRHKAYNQGYYQGSYNNYYGPPRGGYYGY